MEFVNEKITILYGSQTGNAEDVAERLWRESKFYFFKCSCRSMNDYNIHELINEKCIIFVCSTTGQGEEPDNMKTFWKFLLRKNLPGNFLCNLRFAVMGLGDSSYAKFNFAAKRLNKRLKQLGGQELIPLTLGDDQHDLGYDASVDPWTVTLWTKLLQHYPIPAGVTPLDAMIKIEPRWNVSKINFNTATRPMYQSINAEDFQVSVKENFRTTSQEHFQDVRLIKLQTNGEQYGPGDVLILRPKNLPEHVEEFKNILKSNGVNIPPNTVWKVTEKDFDMPVPAVLKYEVTFQQLCEEYFDLSAIPRRSVFNILAQLTDNDLEKEKCVEFTTAEGQQDLYNYVNRPRRNITEVLQDFPHATKNITKDILFELLPSIKPREFSIASSWKTHKNEIHLLVAVVRYKTKLVKERFGLCSNYLACLQPNDKISVWLKKGSFHFPKNPTGPVIMVGPGTGFAPFRNYILDREAGGTASSQNLMLFFGCRSEHADFHCKDELLKLKNEGKLTLICAFSRDQEEKVYVQHKIADNANLIWDALKMGNAHIFVAGNSKTMPAQEMNADEKNGLLLLFYRLREPIYQTKGTENAFLDVPNNYLLDRFRPAEVHVSINQRVGVTVPVANLPVPYFGEVFSLSRDENFSVWVPKHRRYASKLISIFMGLSSAKELLSVATFARDRCNPYLYAYALAVTLAHRADTRDLNLPSYIQIFPENYLHHIALKQATTEASNFPVKFRLPVEIPMDYTATDLDVEHRLAYWREDLGINIHHTHWHIVYPADDENIENVRKDRRGELFAYCHQQIIARYNFERLCNKMIRVVRFSNWSQAIPEPYFPKLIAGSPFPARVADQMLVDLNRENEELRVDISDLERWRDRILEAIHQGFYINDAGEKLEFEEKDGIDVVGNMIESSMLSPNRTYYGNLHNSGHNLLAYIHDPDNRYLESGGVIGFPETAMRDPIFYRWHSHIEYIFQQYKGTLLPYTEPQLEFTDVDVVCLEVHSIKKPNTFYTYWQKSDVDISPGLNYCPKGATTIRFTHLQHHKFEYVITVRNNGVPGRKGTSRIFMAPKFDEKGEITSFPIHKEMFIELDKFVITLEEGINTIKRSSTESNVTIPFDRMFSSNPDGEGLRGCKCGWPHHLLIPKGSPEGFTSKLFVMISDYENDQIEGVLPEDLSPGTSYCGLKNKFYPDRQAMGYPFDRLPRNGVATLDQFLTTNMKVQDVVIRFDDTDEVM